ncbi:hypothetical protein WEN_03010 [Mycoplasma wenyonii str. Massachusetts]|uniref:Uncharacterized protein n=1 Tax=Mycoplasma wenyonii (strain Massachusetts) TaxID=1197325 RepID=I6ZJK8_MYCWM|nr:hypothetical protein [Mycoplasma wenyonii]AFN65385.1 hypothetical protein WEN_03010 [Mycoplasma wenyonii str. Massachusetts]
MTSRKAIIQLQDLNKSKLYSLGIFLWKKFRSLNPYKVSVFTGIIFLTGTVIELYFAISVKRIFLIIRQITWQSNLYAFLLSLLCLVKPSLLSFHFNYLFIGVASLLFTSSIIFLFVLLPAFLNLNLIQQSESIPEGSLIFWNIWNHVATPLSFFNVLVHRLSKDSHKWTITRQVAWFRYKLYWVIQLLGNIYFSFDPQQPSAYGAFSNWYWGKKVTLGGTEPNAQQSSIMLYNFPLSFFAFFIVMAVTCIFFFFLWHLFGPKTEKNSWLKLPSRLNFWG